MPLRIVRNDITKMDTDIIVNTANSQPFVGAGCDYAVYMAAGYEELLEYRTNHIGFVKEGEVFVTPGFKLKGKRILHVVSPVYQDGCHGEEEKLRACYRKGLELAKKEGAKSIAFPLISTGSFGYPREEGMRIAVEEINSFLINSFMDVYLVVFDEKTVTIGQRLTSDLAVYIDQNYVNQRIAEEYGSYECEPVGNIPVTGSRRKPAGRRRLFSLSKKDQLECSVSIPQEPEAEYAFEDALESALAERMSHLSDTFSQYLLYLISQKGLDNADVWKKAIVDKKVFSKIKNNPDYHPKKLTALCLCVGAQLNLDETKDLLSRAGYALSPCDKTDIIFSYFIENEIYDMIELDIQLENHGIPCIIA